MKEVETSNCEEKADLFIKELTVFFILHGCFHRIMDFFWAHYGNIIGQRML